MIYGYVRVSAVSQSGNAQVRQLRAAGFETVFREAVSGARADRVQLAGALAAMEADDVLMGTRFDRLARPARCVLNTFGGRRS